jgi:signal peptide peptidase SppA
VKSYSNIIAKLFYKPLLITPERHASLCQLLEARLGGARLELPIETEPDPDRYDDTEIEMRGDTAIIPVHGTLVMHPEDIAMSECGCAMEDLSSMIDTVERDPNIKRVIYDFRSPGGDVTGVPEAGRKILASRKQTIAFTQSECCSGALWLAAQCERFYATQSSNVGSVGVWCMCLDMTAALKKDGIKVNAISAGKFKLLGAYWRPLSDEERKILQDGVDKTYEQFKQAMESRRMVSDSNFGNGLVFDGEEAAEIGFTDGVVEDMDEILSDLVE